MSPEQAQVNKEIEIAACNDVGSQQSVLLVIPDNVPDKSLFKQVFSDLESEFRIFILSSELPPVDGVTTYIDALSAELGRQNIKRATVLGIGRGASLAQGFAVQCPKMVRRLVLLDATTRIAPGILSRVIDRLERFFPLGLPLRQLSRDFDSRPFVHRIHCPTLILVSSDSSSYILEQAQYLYKKIPNSWMRKLVKAGDFVLGTFSSELQREVREFLQVPVKRPQKVL